MLLYVTSLASDLLWWKALITTVTDHRQSVLTATKINCISRHASHCICVLILCSKYYSLVAVLSTVMIVKERGLAISAEI